MPQWSEVTNYFKEDGPQKIGVVTLVVCMLLSGAAVFIWMAADQWKDKIGVSVAIIFIIIALTQVLFAVLWQRSVKRHAVYETQRAMEDRKGDVQESTLGGAASKQD